MVSGRYAELLAWLRSLEGAVVAFSGGVDSTLLAHAAQEALGARALAVTARSASFARQEHQAARDLAERIGIRHRFVATSELDDPHYRSNPPDRCYHCKRILFRELLRVAAEEGLPVVIEGSNRDDQADYRPGRRALRELGIRSPFAELGWTKAEIRTRSRMLELPTWEKPAAACLASRVPYGEEITAERLARIDRAEELVRAVGVAQVRVRDHGPVARIEVPAEMIPRLTESETRQRLVAELRALGYRYVALDMEGYRTGALNEMLGDAEREANA
ncbi:MAG: ATP-dependent sacrificial sulfur transferase LarE [Candidatus Eisenbacteria bacterium]|nr:ATP-dependent sacrificial sulfur transferase LarE [Candidatus Eisenbacteria bacterium]